MLLFDTQIMQPLPKKEVPKEGSFLKEGGFGAVIQEIVNRVAGEIPKKESNPFMKPANEGPAQKNFSDYERQMFEKAEKFAGPPPSTAGKDPLQVTIDQQKHEMKVLQKYTELISDKKQLEEWRMKKADLSDRIV